ncbi:hypothetical protein MTR_8g009850 [Medicago truncatula]|uniref:Putative plant transposon protein domain-containing protein n=1 Tax=Medicago truncatula TaxID=3880 RepID=A0A072TMD8_MEDTR|nr:hypothetical protein MTR_8g009850 [Medicago truncatula]
MMGKMRKKNNKLELDACELRKLVEKWVDDCDALYAPPSKRSKDVHGARSSSGMKILECASSRHAPIVDERQENDNVHMSEEVIVMDSVVAPPSDLQCTNIEEELKRILFEVYKEVCKSSCAGAAPCALREQMAKQNNAKRKRVIANTSSSSFDSLRFISLVHQERYSKFLAYKKFELEKNFRLEGDKLSDIQAVITTRGWGELTSFAKEASTTLAKEFFANAYIGLAKEDGNYKNDLMKFTSFVRGKKYSVRLRPIGLGFRNKDGTPRKLHSTDLTPIAKAWATFVLHTLLPCSNVSDLTIQKATLLTAILKGEPVNVGRLLVNDLWATANNSSPTSYISHASLINKLCEWVRVYPEKNEEIVKPSGPITAKWIERNPL